MKRELREEIARDRDWNEQSGISRFIDENLSILKAIGLASAIIITGFSAVHLVKKQQGKKGLGNQGNFLI